MKKTLSLVLALILMVSFVSISNAAVTVGGNLRVWYQTTSDENDTTNADSEDSDTFRFDRLALTFASELSAENGFKGEIQFRQPRNDQKDSDSFGTDIRVDNAYYYQKAMFFGGDEMDIGYIQQLPFKGGYNAMVLESLAHTVVKDTNSVGIKYSNKISSRFDIALALLNSKNQYSKDDSSYEGFDYGVRMNYAPISGLKIGLAYVDDVTNDDNYKTAYVVDATYTHGSFGAFVEYLTASNTAGGTTTDLDPATYLELSYKVADPLIFYVGGTAGLGTDAKSLNRTFAYTFIDADANFRALDNWMLFGCKYQLAPNTTLQAEYVSVDGDKTQNVTAVRMIVSF